MNSCHSQRIHRRDRFYWHHFDFITGLQRFISLADLLMDYRGTGLNPHSHSLSVATPTSALQDRRWWLAWATAPECSSENFCALSCSILLLVIFTVRSKSSWVSNPGFQIGFATSGPARSWSWSWRTGRPPMTSSIRCRRSLMTSCGPSPFLSTLPAMAGLTWRLTFLTTSCGPTSARRCTSHTVGALCGTSRSDAPWRTWACGVARLNVESDTPLFCFRGSGGSETFARI